MIVLNMAGGPSHIDTWDPKPGTASGGPFKAIEAGPGMSISEHLPGLAGLGRHLAIVRAMSTAEGSHERAAHLAHTGYSPLGTTAFPSLGAYLAFEHRDEGGDLPAYVSLAGPAAPAGFLGPTYNPFVVNDPLKAVANLRPPFPLPDERLDRRMALLHLVDGAFAAGHPGLEAPGHYALYRKAVQLMRSPSLAAFDLAREDPALRERFGHDRFGQSCLMAARLVKAGVRCVEITLPGWDTHEDNFTRVAKLSAVLDQGWSALISLLEHEGLLDTTLMLWTGEFGRSPGISGKEGRDHHPRAWSTVLAGGGIRGGRVVGATTPDGERVEGAVVGMNDLFATIYTRCGMDPESAMSAGGRPVFLTARGKPLSELLPS